MPPTPTPQPTLEPTPQPTSTPIPLIVVTPSQPDVLPAPVYFLHEDWNKTKQIWLLERNGQTSRQITNEPASVRDFDVSPIDGSLAYVSGFDLFVANADGTARRSVLHDENEVDSNNNDHRRAGARYHSPLWFPDGQRIALADYWGVLFTTLSGQQRRFQLNKIPEVKNPPDMYFKFYIPYVFSPDGQHFLMALSVYENSLLVVKNIDEDYLVEPLILKGSAFCDSVWSRDGSRVFCATNTIFANIPGLYALDTKSGESKEIFQPDFTLSNLWFFEAPYHTRDNKLNFLVTKNSLVRYKYDIGLFQMDLNTKSTLITLRNEFTAAQTFGETLWDSSGQGLVGKAHYFNVQGNERSDTLWLPINGSPAIELRLDGDHMHWGQP